MWMNLLYGFQKRQAAVSVFATPYTIKATVFLYFSVGYQIEQTLDKIRSGFSEQNKIEQVFEL